jgi:hypothetical protein
MTASGRKKMDELYHPATERSEFYTMSDLTKPPVLFTPAEDIDKVSWVRFFPNHIYHINFYSYWISCTELSSVLFFLTIINSWEV